MSGPDIPITPTGAERAFTRPLKALTLAIQSLLVANAIQNQAMRERALSAVQAAITANLALGHMVGSLDTLRTVSLGAKRLGLEPQIRQAMAPVIASPPQVPPLPPIDIPPMPGIGRPPVFREALRDLVSRVPRVVQPEAARTASEIGRLYSTEHVFAAARAADEATLKRVQGIIAEGILEGRSVDAQVRQIVRETGDWTRGYAETVYRTNLNTSQVNGRFLQARSQVARLVTPALMFVATGHGAEGTGSRTRDPRTRPNHWAADGMVAAPEHEWWAGLRPPLGYNCRCTVMAVTWDRLRRMGLVNPDGSLRNRPARSGAGPDPGFRVSRLPA